MRGVQRQRKVRRRRGQSAGGAGCEGCGRRRGVRKALLIGKPWLNLVFGKKIDSSSEMYNLQTDYLLLYLSCLFHTVHISFTRPATRMQRTSNDVVREILGQKSAQYREPASLFWVSSPFYLSLVQVFVCLSVCSLIGTTDEVNDEDVHPLNHSYRIHSLLSQDRYQAHRY